MLTNARIRMQVDVGFGDLIVPAPATRSFPTLLDQDAPRLRMYPPETVVAEKLEAMVKLGVANSRMKDYYDILAVFRIHDMDDDVLAKAIAGTFHRRQTLVPQEVPIGLSDEFGRDPLAQPRWPAFLRRLRIEDAPPDFGEVVKAVREKVWPAMQKALRRS